MRDECNLCALPAEEQNQNNEKAASRLDMRCTYCSDSTSAIYKEIIYTKPYNLAANSTCDFHTKIKLTWISGVTWYRFFLKQLTPSWLVSEIKLYQSDFINSVRTSNTNKLQNVN